MEATAPPERPKNLCQVADYLLSPQSGLKKRDGVFNESRVTYFRGKGAVNALLKPVFRQSAIGKELGDLTRESAAELLGSMIPHQFFLKVERSGDHPHTHGPGTEPHTHGPKNQLSLVQYQSFGEDGVFVWRYEGSQLRSHLMAGGMLLLVLAGVMFPLWPMPLRLGVWYLSVGVLILIGLFFGLAIVRLILFGLTWAVLKPGIWIFPNLFEDVGVVDSFIPLWGWHVPEEPEKVEKVQKVVTRKAHDHGAHDHAHDHHDHGAHGHVHTEVVSEEVAQKITKRRPMVEDAADEDL
ncbi:Translocation protein S62 [Dissophora globulifera]|uniref:Translocation protein SEC62 n=1 Tax=Dissophora globulifera TaxID=979702 RepID=A0A9P6RJ49_9FUNG|nr:Translocation protein S62 [Dissophora globulifera]